jgi:hypothetical protein
MLGLFCLFVAAPFVGRKAVPISRVRGIVATLALVGWLCVVLIETLWAQMA